VVREEGGGRWEVVGPCEFSRAETEGLRELWEDSKAKEIVFV
jgi:hypothetical protein